MAALMLAAAACGGCHAPSAPSSQPSSSQVFVSSPSARSGSSAAGAAAALCFGQLPASWGAVAGSRTVPLPGEGVFSVDTVDAAAAYGYAKAADGSRSVARLDLATGTITAVAPLAASAGGVGWVSADGPWVVWEQLDSQVQLAQWSIHAWNRDTGQARQLATTVSPDGKVAAGQQALPVVWGVGGRHARAAWAQPVIGTGPVTSELRVVDLAAGENTTDQVRVLATGRLSSPVLAGGMLAWASLDAAGAYAFHAVDARTLAPVPLPSQLADPGTIGYLAGSGDYLAWSDQSATGLTVWHLGTQDVRHYRAGDGRHFFQFLQIAGHDLVWFSTGATSVLDLESGGAFDLPDGTGGAAGADWLALEHPATPATTTSGKASALTQIPAQAEPEVDPCR